MGIKASPWHPGSLPVGELQGRDCSSANSPFQLAGVLRFKGNLWSKTGTLAQPLINPAGKSYPSLLLWICFVLTCSGWVLLPVCLLDHRALCCHIPVPSRYLQMWIKSAHGLLSDKSNKLNSQLFHYKSKFSGLLIVLIALLRASSKLAVCL